MMAPRMWRWCSLLASIFITPSFGFLSRPMSNHGSSIRSEKMSTGGDENGLKEDSSSKPPEVFSVAPMMAHSNRHYRQFIRPVLGPKAWLYTEMIPAGQIVQSFRRIGQQLLGKTVDDFLADPDQLQQMVFQLKEQQYHRRPWTSKDQYDPVLEELLNPGIGPIALQLGGRDPIVLAHAAAIGTAFGFDAINLNCGCPSVSVASGRATGAALMLEADVVAQCLEAMSTAMDAIDPSTVLSVKHRLGVVNLDDTAYDAANDRAQDDTAAHHTCHEFIRVIRQASKLSRVQVHGRIALLGLDACRVAAETSSTSTALNSDDDDDDYSQNGLWVPHASSSSSSPSTTTGKVNHQRLQYQAKKQARQATLQNRSVPPLRPRVVDQIACDFPDLQVTTNGGIQSLEEAQRRVHGKTPVVGVMVGRAAINHPCSFAGMEDVLFGTKRTKSDRKSAELHDEPASTTTSGTTTTQKNTRHHALHLYIDYCYEEENRLAQLLLSGEAKGAIMQHRKRLVAAPFHLFLGEPGNDAFQRRLRKLVARADRHTAPAMLGAAMTEVPFDGECSRAMQDHVPWAEIPTYDFTKRSGALQRTIY